MWALTAQSLSFGAPGQRPVYSKPSCRKVPKAANRRCRPDRQRIPPALPLGELHHAGSERLVVAWWWSAMTGKVAGRASTWERAGTLDGWPSFHLGARGHAGWLVELPLGSAGAPWMAGRA